MSPRAAATAAVVAVALAAALGWWLGPAEDVPATASATSAPGPALMAWPPATARAATASLPAASAPRPSAPLSPLGKAERRAQLALWQGRLERAQATLDGYRTSAQYPHESRPIEEHPDQVRPFEPISEERALRMPGGTAPQDVKLLTTQERVFASGTESSRVTVALQSAQGRPLPLRVTRAVIREVTPPGATASTAEFTPDANDAGRAGDARAGDGVISVLVHPAAQGFGGFAGTVRLELLLEHAGQPGFLYFDLVYSPETAAVWLPGVREAASPAGIDFFVKAMVRLPGRYVVSARIDDVQGEPVALASFNAEVGAGEQEFRLPVFGKLLRDTSPAMPLKVRDIEAFLLKPDRFPDRVMLPRHAGVQHTSRVHAIASFSNAEWEGEEKTRYLTELTKDVDEATRQVQRLGP
ncbi:MAG: hypothetical protein ING89_12690 [Rubrivivax sp.]|nr:hypothetical protein [Rubrivivax sp.]